MFVPHSCCVSMDVCFVLFLLCLYICVCVWLQIQSPLREGCSIRTGASGLPYYCTPPVCVSDVIGVLAVWRHYKTKNSAGQLLAVRLGLRHPRKKEMRDSNCIRNASTAARPCNGHAETTSDARCEWSR